MKHYIDKSALVAEIDKEIKCIYAGREYVGIPLDEENIVYGLQIAKGIINTLEVKEPASTSYVITRCEEHSDYVEKVFFDEDKAQEYCDQFNGNENEYARHITRVEITL